MTATNILNGSWYLGDCLEIMKNIPDASVDMILCDLPYGTTQNKWDNVIPFEPLWIQYWRVAKPRAAVVLTASQPFTSALVMSQVERFKYEWIWEKTAGTGFLNAKKAPLKVHENILVFYRKPCTYNPQKTAGHEIKRVNRSYPCNGENYGKSSSVREPYVSTDRYPRDVVIFPKDNRLGRPHPTQKPVALFEYLIKTYTNQGDVVLDNCAGSGTTAIACENTDRKWICIEQDEEYSSKALDRIKGHVVQEELI